jgi:hypothetical protein
LQLGLVSDLEKLPQGDNDAVYERNAQDRIKNYLQQAQQTGSHGASWT